MTCLACDRIAEIRRGKTPHFVAELSESFVVLSDEQGYPGWCILLLKDHHEHLAALPLERQCELWKDVAQVSRAITKALAPVRINYECLGNQLNHIHWHVVPRYANDPDPKMPIWLSTPDFRRGSMSENDRKEMILRLSGAIRATQT